MRSLLRLSDLDDETVASLLSRAGEFREVLRSSSPTAQPLSGSTVANVFFENSTRTQMSFDLAGQRLGAKVLNFNQNASSVSKGESLQDTVQTIASIGADVLVVRHSDVGVPAKVAGWTDKAVVNAGEGIAAHPTQALLDAVTMIDRFGGIDNLRVGVVGDVSHSRVARSLIHLLGRLGAETIQIGPPEFLDSDLDAVSRQSLDEVIAGLDVVYLLRVQSERGAVPESDYGERYQLNSDRFGRLSQSAVVMHPGPVNRGVEIEDRLMDEKRCLILDQVANGTPTRMAVLEWVVGG